MKMAFDLCRIGQLLRETREKKGLTFDEVSNALCIKWDHLPHPVYVKGYVTHYATFLNMLGALKSELASGENESPAHNLSGRRFETAADEACTGKADRIWRSIFATSTLKFYELCQKCFLL
ncbi:MAG: helix-turn-helix transcriptional regulator [Syntrophorhabdales bacterium]